MIYPQILLISSNSTLRRLYHRILSDTDCELHTAKSITEALATMAVKHIDIVIIVSPLPDFELSMFLDLLSKRPQWEHVSLIAVGYEHIRHVFSKDTHFANSNDEVVSTLKEFLTTLS